MPVVGKKDAGEGHGFPRFFICFHIVKKRFSLLNGHNFTNCKSEQQNIKVKQSTNKKRTQSMIELWPWENIVL